MSTMFSILFIDSDVQLIETLQQAAERSGLELVFHQVHRAGEAKVFLEQASSQLPDLIWLSIDLLDRDNELDFLAWLRTQNQTYELPVVILTDSPLPCDVVASYSFNATSFRFKPFSLTDWVAYLTTLNYAIPTGGNT